jgi:uncharacterized protein (DUF2062 family)
MSKNRLKSPAGSVVDKAPPAVSAAVAHSSEPQPKWRGIFYSRFIQPLVSSRNPPWFDARGVAVGLAIGFGVPVGIQMIVLGLLRLIFRFNAVIAFAFTWVNNPLTLIPMYYAYYCLGSLLLGRPSVMGLEAFRDLLRPLLTTSYFWEALRSYISLGEEIITRWSVTAVLVSMVSATVGYVAAYRVQRDRCIRRAERIGLTYENLLKDLGRKAQEGRSRATGADPCP